MGAGQIRDFGNQEVSSTPVYSMARIMLDVTPVASTLVFNSAKGPLGGNGGAGVTDVQFFSYGLGDTNAQNAGFGTKTRPTTKHTNVQKGMRVPKGGRMSIESLAFLYMGYISFPTIGMPATDANDIVDDTPGKQAYVADWKAGQLFSYAARIIDSCFAVYYQFGASSGEKRYLPSVSLLPPGRGLFDGRASYAAGPPFVMADGGILWDNDGNQSDLIVGLEQRRNLSNLAWSSTAGTAQMFTDIAAALSVSNAAAPAAGLWQFNVDIMCVAYGYRKTPLSQ